MNRPFLFIRPLRSQLSALPKPITNRRRHVPLQLTHHQSTSSAAPPAPPPPAETHSPGNSYAEPPETLSHNVTSAEETAYDHTLAAHVKKQARSPWLRSDADTPPAERIGSDAASGAGRGKLLTTPSRMLKLIVRLASREMAEREAREDGKRDLEPLALLVHPQQPLSYLERLIQS